MSQGCDTLKTQISKLKPETIPNQHYPNPKTQNYTQIPKPKTQMFWVSFGIDTYLYRTELLVFRIFGRKTFYGSVLLDRTFWVLNFQTENLLWFSIIEQSLSQFSVIGQNLSGLSTVIQNYEIVLHVLQNCKRFCELPLFFSEQCFRIIPLTFKSDCQRAIFQRTVLIGDILLLELQ